MKRFNSTALRSLTIFAIFVFIHTGEIAAQVATLSVQGVLTKSDGTAVDDDTYTMTFRLWNDPNATGAGNKKYEETITDVETIGGVYSVVLGANGQALDAPFNEVYYLGVSMNSSNVELLPRPRLTHAPYALAIKGQNNTFPSVGTVLADALVVPGGAPSVGVAGKGYSFGTGGDQDGGLFSVGDNNVGLYANATKALEASSSGVSIPGTLQVSNGTTLNGGSTLNGGATVNGGQTVNNGLTVNNSGNTFNISSDYAYSSNRFLTKWQNEGGGYSFKDDGAYDSGMFGYGDGFFALVTNGFQRVAMGNNTVISNAAGYTTISTGTDIRLTVGNAYDYFLENLKAKTSGNWKNLIWDVNSNKLAWDNSSRKYKINIKPLEDDFSLILQSQPRVYSRYDGDTTYHEVGYIAEEMDSIGLHRLVERDKNGVINGFDYTKMILYVTEVLKTQHEDIEKLQAEVALLKAENNGLRTENTTLSTVNATFEQQQSNFSAQLETLSKRIQSIESSGNSKK